MRTTAYKVDVAMRPPQARVSQAKLFVLKTYLRKKCICCPEKIGYTVKTLCAIMRRKAFFQRDKGRGLIRNKSDDI